MTYEARFSDGRTVRRAATIDLDNPRAVQLGKKTKMMQELQLRVAGDGALVGEAPTESDVQPRYEGSGTLVGVRVVQLEWTSPRLGAVNVTYTNTGRTASHTVAAHQVDAIRRAEATPALAAR